MPGEVTPRADALSGPRRLAVLSVHTCPLAALGRGKAGGLNVYMRNLCRELGRRDLAIDVFTRAQADCRADDCRADDCRADVIHRLGSRVRVIHLLAGPPVTLAPARVAAFLDPFTAGIVAFAQRHDVTYDLIHSHYWLSGLVAGKLRRAWSGPPVVHMFHTLGAESRGSAPGGPAAHEPAAHGPAPGRRPGTGARVAGESRVVAVADRLIAATPDEARRLIATYGAAPGRIKVIPPGVDLERFTGRGPRIPGLRLPPAEHRLLAVARIEPVKGLATLLRALATIRDRRRRVYERTALVIVGGAPDAPRPGSEMARLRRLAARLEIAERVCFAGAQGHDRLPAYYAWATVTVMPSDHESFGMVALESLAAGTPVIASDVGGLVHLVTHGENGYRVPAGDPEALSGRVLQVLDDAPLRRRLGRRGRRWARPYAWPRIADRMVELYADVLTGAAVRSDDG